MPSTISAGTTAGTAIVVAGDTSGNLAFQTNGTTTAMTIDTSQNVGIGTSSPTSKLHVNGTITAEAFVGVFPSGTKMMFVQTTAPTGWTKDTIHDNKALRIVSGTASSGGSVGFTSAFASQSVTGTVGNTTLTTSQIPSHRHYVRGDFRGDSIGVQFGGNGSTNNSNLLPAAAAINTNSYTGVLYGWDEGGGQAHNHSFSGTAINMAVQYVDAIIATKD